jgi:hypothetical protein
VDQGYSFEVAWTGNLTGVFTLDRSLLDGTDVLSSFFGGNVFDDMTERVEACRIRRGRSGDLTAIQQGSCTLLLNDTDGTFNPENPSSPLAGLLVPMRPVRARRTHLGTTYGLFYGFVSRIEHDPDLGVQQSRLECVDFFEWLSTSKPIVAATGTTTIGSAIGAILDYLEWSDPTMRALDVGMEIPNFSADGSASGLQLIQDLLAVDLGTFFVDGDGVVTYHDRDRRFAAGSVVDSFTGSYLTGVKPSTDVRNIVNRQTVERTGGVQQTVTDESSRMTYGYREGTTISSSYLSSDSQAAVLAAFKVFVQKDPRPPTRQATMSDVDDATTTKQLARELGDRISLGSLAGGTSTTAVVESIEHVFSAADGQLETTFVLSKRLVDGFTLDTSVLDGSHVLTY